MLTDAELFPVLAALASELPALRTVLVAGPVPEAPPAHWRTAPWRDHASAREWDGPDPAASETACIMYTSGTTGPSKGVLRKQGIAEARDMLVRP